METKNKETKKNEAHQICDGTHRHTPIMMKFGRLVKR